eukprot:1196203-Prorocentrum_minimum.AAC.6
MRSSSIVRAVFVCALCAVGVKVVFFHSVATHPAHSHLNGVSPRNPFKHYSSAQSTHGSNRISEIEDRNSLLWDSAYDTDGRASVSTLSQCGVCFLFAPGFQAPWFEAWDHNRNMFQFETSNLHLMYSNMYYAISRASYTNSSDNGLPLMLSGLKVALWRLQVSSTTVDSRKTTRFVNTTCSRFATDRIAPKSLPDGLVEKGTPRINDEELQTEKLSGALLSLIQLRGTLCGRQLDNSPKDNPPDAHTTVEADKEIEPPPPPPELLRRCRAGATSTVSRQTPNAPLVMSRARYKVGDKVENHLGVIGVVANETHQVESATHPAHRTSRWHGSFVQG